MKRRLVVPAVVLTLFSGCGVLYGERDLPIPAAAPILTGWTGCLGAQPDGDFRRDDPAATGSIPVGFRTTRAVICANESRTRDDGALTTVAVELVATDVGRLTSALALPSRTFAQDQACPAIGWVSPWLVLVDEAGRWIRPGLPRDGCGQPRSEVTAALQGLATTTTTLKNVRVDESAAAVRSGCSQQWKDMVVETLDHPGSSPVSTAVTADPFAGRPVRRCVYAVGGRPGEGGTFVHGGPLSADERRAVVAALVGSPAAPPTCRESAAEFALLQRTDNSGALVYVELSGCGRILVSSDHDSVASAGADLVELLR